MSSVSDRFQQSKQEFQEASVSRHYPDFIINDDHKYRCVKILVKKQDTLVQSAGELVELAKKTYDDYKSIGNDDNPSTNAKQNERAIKRSERLLKSLKWGVALPLPNELNDSQSHQWETTKGAVGEIVGGVENTQFGIGSITRSASQVLGEGASSKGFRKALINPGYFQNYNGTDPRTFTFSWDLIPNNPNEAKSIVDIIYNIKKYTLPETAADGLTLFSPYVFDLEIGNPIIDVLMNMSNLVCTNVDIQYAAEGALQFLSEGYPKYIKLSMTFTETLVDSSNWY